MNDEPLNIQIRISAELLREPREVLERAVAEEAVCALRRGLDSTAVTDELL